MHDTVHASWLPLGPEVVEWEQGAFAFYFIYYVLLEIFVKSGKDFFFLNYRLKKKKDKF